MKLLVLNCHEAWVHQLAALGAELDVVIGLAGRYTATWDSAMRPLPAGARTLTLDEAKAGRERYDAVINHNITDLLDTSQIDAAKVLILHDMLEGRIEQQDAAIDPAEMRRMLGTYLAAVGGVSVAISRTKSRSWGGANHVVENSVDSDAYLPWVGDLRCGLRVANHITSKRVFLSWDFHETAFAGLPVRIVGHNPDMPGVSAANDWEHLKRMLAAHRFFIHTADPRFEDGYNMAVLEAMAAGLPVLTNRNPTTIVKHGETGFVAGDPAEMRAYAAQLLDNADLARELGEKGRSYVMKHHSPGRFRVQMTRAIADAKRKHARKVKIAR
jgi:glycosyltransferase involved in cell wall biosynthesis